jgi:hypothetical protein
MSIINHFIVNESVFELNVDSVFASHDINNLSDHDPLFGIFDITCVPRTLSYKQKFYKKFAWGKASYEHISQYTEQLAKELALIHIPIEAMLCCD